MCTLVFLVPAEDSQEVFKSFSGYPCVKNVDLLASENEIGMYLLIVSVKKATASAFYQARFKAMHPELIHLLSGTFFSGQHSLQAITH